MGNPHTCCEPSFSLPLTWSGDAGCWRRRGRERLTELVSERRMTRYSTSSRVQVTSRQVQHWRRQMVDTKRLCKGFFHVSTSSQIIKDA